MLLQSRTTTLDQLRMIDFPQSSILSNPLLNQVLVATALQAGNRSLVRDLITSVQPGPGHDLLFGADKGLQTLGGSAHDFSGHKAYGHGALAGQPDNGCEIWVTMIRAGWAVPRQYMQGWAATSAAVDAGKQLFDVLLEHNVEITGSAAFAAVMHGRYELLDYALNICTPADELTRNMLLEQAATRELRYIKLLFEYGVDDINWIPGGAASMPRSREDTIPSRTLLHAAAEYGEPEVVDILLRHGAEIRRDYFGRTPLDLARNAGRAEVMEILTRQAGGN